MRTRGFKFQAAGAFAVAAMLLASAIGADGPISAAPAANRVELRQTAGQWKLFVADQPFFIKGAGGEGSMAKLKEAGGNSIRTWGTDRLQSVLDRAAKNGLKVCVGIWLHHEKDTEGFDYSKPEMVQAQLEQVSRTVNRFKDHPAVLLWGLGNEMEGYDAGNKPEIWQAVNEAAKRTKQLDPNHPTMTVISELGGERVACIHRYCPDVDIVGVNSYAGSASVDERYRRLNGTKPYILTEFGPPGPWETASTSWGAALEPTSTEKGDWYRRAYQGAVLSQPLCLGSYAFLWGQKQETTVTWYGMFLKDGTKLQAVDTMTELWTGAAPQARCPIIRKLHIRDLREFNPGTTFTAELEASDPDGRALEVRWVVQPEQPKKLTAGAEEESLPELSDIVLRNDNRSAELRTPLKPGGYRLFVYVRNGIGAAVANVPFFVASGKKTVADRKSP